MKDEICFLVIEHPYVVQALRDRMADLQPDLPAEVTILEVHSLTEARGHFDEADLALADITAPRWKQFIIDVLIKRPMPLILTGFWDGPPRMKEHHDLRLLPKPTFDLEKFDGIMRRFVGLAMSAGRYRQFRI